MNNRFQAFLFSLVFVIFVSVSSYPGVSFSNPPTGYLLIKSVQVADQNSGYWDQPGVPAGFEKGVRIILNSKDGKTDQQFKFIKAGNEYYYIQSGNGGVVDIDGGRLENGSAIQLWSGHGGSNQLFRFKNCGGGRWKIYTLSSMVISVSQSAGNGSSLQIWEDNDGPWTEWYFEKAENLKN